MVDFMLYGEPSITGDFTLVVDLEFGAVWHRPWSFWVFGILAFLPLLWGVYVHCFDGRF
jgi:hypothetical protein